MLRELVEKNRSYRGFDESRSVSREELLELVDLTRYTASGFNMQPLKYLLICEKDEVEALLPRTKWGAALPQLKLPYPGKHPAAFIVICHDTSLAPNADSAHMDVGIVAQTMMLGAVERGLGGCMIQNFKPGEVKAALGLAEHLVPKLVLGIGKPDEEIHIVGVGENGSMKYYRDENDVHYVPKRDLKDLVIE